MGTISACYHYYITFLFLCSDLEWHCSCCSLDAAEVWGLLSKMMEEGAKAHAIQALTIH